MLKIGMIGAGFIGQLAHLMNLIEIPQCKVLALAEYKPRLRQQVAARYDIPYTYATHTELLQNSEIDAVVVVTPRPYTGPVVLDCLKAGKHVLSEKPMVGCVDHARVLLNAAEANQVRYAVGYMKRYDEGVNQAKKILNDALQTRKLGEIQSVHATCFMGNSYCNPYGHVVTDEKSDYELEAWSIAPRWLPECYHQPFGAYLNTYSHVTNLLRYLFDKSPSIEYVNLTDNVGQLAVLNFQNFLATLSTGKLSHRGWSEEVKITFTDGEITLSLPPALLRNIPASIEVYQAGTVQQYIRPCVNWSWAFKRQAEGFVQSVLDNQPLRISASEAYEDLCLIENLWQAELLRLNVSHQAMEACL